MPWWPSRRRDPLHTEPPSPGREAEPPLERLTAQVHGFVQGVGYRDFCHRIAYDLGRGRPHPLSGYARNLPSGSTVEVVAEGPRPLLDALLERLYEGPSMARVTRIDVSWGSATREFDRFTTRY